MFNPNFILLYVEAPQASAAFYAKLLGAPPVDSSPTFCLFALPSGVMLGLWGRAGVQPPASGTGGGELAFTVEGRGAVDAAHAQWRGMGIEIAQAPAAMDFGYTFTALDPDGHRLRVFAPAG